jgi:hypothetical protein
MAILVIRACALVAAATAQRLTAMLSGFHGLLPGDAFGDAFIGRRG